MMNAQKSISRGGCPDMAPMAARSALRPCNRFATGLQGCGRTTGEAKGTRWNGGAA